MAKKTASEDALGDLHSALAKVLTDAVKNGVTVLDKDGNEVSVTCPAAVLNAARQFLKDNGIECQPQEHNPLGELARSMPKFDDQGNILEDRLN